GARFGPTPAECPERHARYNTRLLRPRSCQVLYREVTRVGPTKGCSVNFQSPWRMRGDKMRVFRAIAILVLASRFPLAATAGPLDDAIAAEGRDDCATAVSNYQALAEKGNIQAFKRLGYFSLIG